MRLSVTSFSTILATLGVIACSGADATLPPLGQGGAVDPSMGGNPGIGGNVGVGGSISNGGSFSSGGSTPRGGSISTGGNVGAGGVISTGGTMQGAGGVVSTGGTMQGAGGIFATGGSPAAGGINSATGGMPATGGVSSNCTDTLPPNGTCADAVAYNWCGQSWMNGACAATCGLCSGGAGGAPSNGGTPATGGTRATGGAQGAGGNPATGGTRPATGGVPATGGTVATGGTTTSSSGTNPPITGSNGYATRYWDCCKPSCSWTTNVPSCSQDGTSKITDKNANSGCDSGGTAFECYDFSPWYDSSTNMAYGFAAHNSVACGACFELQFTGDGNSGANPGAQAIKGKQMIVQVINIGGLAADQFDLLIPGGGIGAMTNGCKTQWGSSTDFGATYGGLLSECNGDATCMKGKCTSVFGSIPSLLAGCNWFTGWYSSADNPKVIYKQVTCPSQITSKTGVSG